MICEKCGKSNPGGIEKCTYCGADMPETFICSGFADILTKQHNESADGYPTTERISGNNINTGVNEEDMKQILNNSEMTLRAAKKSSALAMMAVILCALTLVCSIVFGVMILSKGTNAEEPAEDPKDNVTEQKPEEQEPEEQKPEEQKPEEQKPEEQKPDEQNPDEQNPDEQNPDEQNPDEQNPDEQTPNEQGDKNHLDIFGLGN